MLITVWVLLLLWPIASVTVTRQTLAGAELILVIGSLALGCFVAVVLRNAPIRNALLLLVALGGGLTLHAIEPYSGLGFVFSVVLVAPKRLGSRSAVALTLLALASTPVLSWRIGVPPADLWAIVAGLACTVLFSLALWYLAQVRRHGVELGEAMARETVLADRTRLVREIHDVLAHSQSAQIVHLEGARDLLARGGDAVHVRDRIERALRLTRAGLEETRRALDALRGAELPLSERLALLADEFSSATGAPCAVAVQGEFGSLATGARLAVARTAQEALTNVRKHAPGSEARLALRRVGGWCELEVHDFHKGDDRQHYDDLKIGGGYGLVGMRERAELIGGSLVAGPSSDGFVVLLRVPA